jgi:hypothetical protein
VFADAGGRLLLWPFSVDPKGKYSVLVESVGSKVVCLAASPAAKQAHTTQELQQVRAVCPLLLSLSLGSSLHRVPAAE